MSIGPRALGVGDAAVSVSAASTRHGASRALPLAAIGVAFTAFAWLSHVNPAFPPWDDGIRDQLMARDCTELGQCHLIGASTSLAGFYQGAAWLDLLIAVRLLGGDIATERIVVLILLALSVVTLFIVIWRWLRPSIAFPAAVILIGVLGIDPYPSQLINPSACAFPDILTAAGLLCYGLSAERRFLILSAFTLGVAINVHVGSLSLVPPLVVIAALGKPRPWRELLAAVAVLLGTYFITSRAALLANIFGLTSHGRLVPALAGGLAIALLSAWRGCHFRGLTWNARAWVIGVILVLPFVLASLWLVAWQQHHFGITYLHPILGPAAALAAAIVSLPFELAARRWGTLRWVPTAAALIAITVVGVRASNPPNDPAPRESDPWTLADTKVIANEAARRGWSYEDLLLHVQSSACRELLAAMSIDAPPPTVAAHHGRRQLQVVKVTRDAVTNVDPRNVLPLERGKVAVVREIESWLQPESLVACRAFGSGQAPVCSAPDPGNLGARISGHFLFAMRSYPQVHHFDEPPPFIATYQIPLVSVAGRSRDLRVIDPAEPDCSWRVTRADGLQVEGPLPARHVRLHSENGSPGLLVIEKPFGTAGCAANEIDRGYEPCVFESEPDDPLAAAAEAG
jgi:hypothetical protein